MGERRERDRIVVEKECPLVIGNRRVPARMVNFSDLGALFHIMEESPDAVTDDDLGLDAVFVHPVFNPRRRYTGEIFRRYFEGGVQYIAVRFWSPYTAMPQ